MSLRSATISILLGYLARRFATIAGNAPWRKLIGSAVASVGVYDAIALFLLLAKDDGIAPVHAETDAKAFAVRGPGVGADRLQHMTREAKIG